MADCLTQCSTQQLKSRVLWLYTGSNSPNMNKTILLLFLSMGICFACLVTYMPKLILFMVPVSNRWLASSSSDMNSYPQSETSVILRVRQKIPIDPGECWQTLEYHKINSIFFNTLKCIDIKDLLRRQDQARHTRHSQITLLFTFLVSRLKVLLWLFLCY